MTWYVIETLSPDTATVCFAGDKAVEWQSVSRLGGKLGVDLDSLVATVRASGEREDSESEVRGTATRIIAEPALGPDGVVQAVSVWVGAAGDEPTTAPKLGPLYVDLAEYKLVQTLECFMLSANSPADFSADRDPTLFLRKVIRFDKIPEFLQMAANPTEGSKFSCFMNIHHEAGHLMYWLGLARYDHDGKKIRALGQDITEFSAPEVHPAALASVDDGSLSRKSGALLIGFPGDQTQEPVLNYWMTPPPVRLRLNSAEKAGHHLHPDDVAAVWDVQRRLVDAEKTTQLSVFVRIAAGDDDDWVPTQTTFSPYPSETVGPAVLVARVRVLEDSEVAAMDAEAVLSP